MMSLDIREGELIQVPYNVSVISDHWMSAIWIYC